METTFKDIAVRAAQVGVNITELCRNAGANRSTVQRWKNGRIRQTCETFKKIIAELDRLQLEIEPAQ